MVSNYDNSRKKKIRSSMIFLTDSLGGRRWRLTSFFTEFYLMVIKRRATNVYWNQKFAFNKRSCQGRDVIFNPPLQFQMMILQITKGNARRIHVALFIRNAVKVCIVAILPFVYSCVLFFQQNCDKSFLRILNSNFEWCFLAIYIVVSCQLSSKYVCKYYHNKKYR